MQVLKAGRKQRGQAIKLTCTGKGNGGGGCGAKLLVGQYDLYNTHSSHYDGSTESYITFCCPECGTETDVERTGFDIRGTRPSANERARMGHEPSS